MAGHKYNPKMAYFLTSPLRKLMINPQKVLNELNVSKTDIWADVGCGIGFFTIPFAQMVKKVYAVDISKEMLEILRERQEKQKIYNVEVLQSSESILPLRNESVNGIFLAFVAHELDEPAKSVFDFSRCLKPHGRLIILEYANTNSIFGPPQSHRLSQEQMDQWAAAAGLKRNKTWQYSKSMVVWEYVK